MAAEDTAIEVLLEGVLCGDGCASEQLLGLHRERLKRMVAVRMDRRLCSRLDPSDVVQDALAEANLHLPEYARTRPLPFYPWLRRLAWERMVAMARHHIGSRKRSVVREEPAAMRLPDESALDLAGRLAASGTSPSGRLTRQELRDSIHLALVALESNDREVLILRYLEQLSTSETAAVLGISEGGVKSRLMRALVRLRAMLEGPDFGDAVMNELAAASGSDPVLAELFDELTNKLQAGETVDIEPYLRQHPEYEQTLQNFLPAIEMLVSLGRYAMSSRQPANAREPLALAELGDLGDFRLLREVGRGGMGIVYEAVQISLNRRVALKVLPFATALDAKQLQRFKNEAQAAACLHHQNIVSVYGVGCERGVHFYAMQFIEGQTLADLIRELRQRSGLDGPESAAPQSATDSTAPIAAALTPDRSDKPRTFFRVVAQFGVQAARGLEHAHQLGVVHRDIKPANLLLDPRSGLWITDFGLAHCQSQAGLTMTGDMVGTLRYMSPEQAMATRVPIDQRVDIYSLGATLYEFLTLQPPFGGSDRRELLRQICFEEPRPLRRINPEVPEELEIIVLKAMAKLPGDRYASAQELVEDLDRFLEHKPIRAERPTLVQRAKKLTLRHRGVTVTVGIASGLVLLLVVAFLVYRNNLVANQRDEADQLRLLAEERFQQARQAVDTMYTQFAKKWLAQQPQMEPVEREFLNKALVFYEKLAGGTSTDPRVRFETAQAYVRVAEIQHHLGESEQAEKAYNQAVPLLQGLVDDFPQEPEYCRELADALHNLGVLWGDAGRLPEEERVHLRAIALQRQLAEKYPGSSAYRRDLARGLYHLGCKHAFTGRWDTRVFLAQAAGLQQVLAIELPGVPEVRAELADSLNRLGNEKSLRKAVDLLERLLAESPGNPGYRNSLAESYYYLSENLPNQESETAILRAIAILEKLLADFPKVTNNRFDLVRSLFSLARILERTGRREAAIEIYRKGLAPGEPLTAIAKIDYFRSRIAEGHAELAELFIASGNSSEATNELQVALTLQRALAAEFPGNSAYQQFSSTTQRRLAALQKRMGQGVIDSVPDSNK